MTVTVLSKTPPGGRCSLYIQFAEELARRFNLKAEVDYLEVATESGHCPPAMLLRGEVILPSDGVIISPKDVCHKLEKMGFGKEEVAELHGALEEIQENLFAETGKGIV